MGPVDCCVDMYDHQKHKHGSHINMLKKWYQGQEPNRVNLAEQVDEHTLTEDVPTWQSATTNKSGEPMFEKHLMISEWNNLNDLISEFHDVLSIKPGKTDLIEYNIVTNTTKPIKLLPHRVPQACQTMVMQKIKEMLNQGIIESSVSE